MLDAAMRVAVRDGIVAVTLDAVAREAGLSKGGLLHHFRTKHDLIAALMQEFQARTLGVLADRLAADPDPRGRVFRLMMELVLRPRSQGAPASEAEAAQTSRLFTALLVAAAHEPGLLESFRREMARLLERGLAEGSNGLRQVALLPAIHGLLLWRHLGILGQNDPLGAEIVSELLRLAEGPESRALESESAA